MNLSATTLSSNGITPERKHPFMYFLLIFFGVQFIVLVSGYSLIMNTDKHTDLIFVIPLLLLGIVSGLALAFGKYEISLVIAGSHMASVWLVLAPLGIISGDGGDGLVIGSIFTMFISVLYVSVLCIGGALLWVHLALKNRRANYK